MPRENQANRVSFFLEENVRVKIVEPSHLDTAFCHNLENVVRKNLALWREIKELIPTNTNEVILDIPSEIKKKVASVYFNDVSLSGQSYSLESRLAIYLATPQNRNLRAFQTKGIEWLKPKDRAILADDMGLGKTVQALIALEDLIRSGEVTRALIVCPRSLVMNWINETSKWTPFLTSTCVIAPSSTAISVWKKRVGKSHIIVTSYEQLRSYSKEMINQAEIVIADEAHKLRRSQSMVSKVFKTLNPRKLWLLTGTPLERNIEDYVNLLSILDENRFSKKDVRDGEIALKHKAKPFILRRTKQEVLPELPKILEIHETLELTPNQKTTYIKILKDSDKNPLAKYQALRSICDYDPVSKSSSKIDRIVDLIEEIHAQKDKFIVFSYWLEPLSLLLKTLQEKGLCEVQLLTGKDSIKERERKIHEFRGSSQGLLASAKIASEGLTLTEANHVIFINRYWNPSNNNQAKDRILRIGQKKGTFSYTFTCKDTVEELIEVILADKAKSFEIAIEDISKLIASHKDL